jgi:stage II sporulation protein M
MKKKRKKFSLKKEYKECWSYIKESKKFIYAVIVIFFAFMLVGFFVPAPTYLTEQIMNFIEELLTRTEGLSRFELVRFIFFNNLKSSFFGMVLGSLLGIFPILSTIANGYLLGFVSAFSAAKIGIFSLWRILPHGIFELPAIFISLGLGLKLGTFVFQKEKFESFRKYLRYSLKVFLFIILPLLIIAGIIEGCFISFAG